MLGRRVISLLPGLTQTSVGVGEEGDLLITWFDSDISRCWGGG